MSYLEDHVGGLVKINALVYLHNTGEYIRLKNHFCILAEVDDYNCSTGELAEAETDGAMRQLSEPTWNRKPIFQCSFFIEDKMLRLLFCEREVEVIK